MTSKPAQLDVCGVAYLCVVDNHAGFVGLLLTKDKVQYNLTGKLHTCSPEAVEDEDHHTCCFDESCQKLDLLITKVDAFDFGEQLTIPHVMKTEEDNFTLTSRHVQFITDDLYVGSEAEYIAVKYLSTNLAGKDCLVCVGEMKIKYPLEELS